MTDLDNPPADPWSLFRHWYEDARVREPAYPECMTLATLGDGGRPAARVVLMKAFDTRGIVFHTNHDSRKGHELAAYPQAALLFHWKSLERQIRVEGRVAPINNAESDAYFANRPRASQIGAWASLQSQLLANRAEFEARLATMETRFADGPVPRPPHWGGFRLNPDYFEFWQERPYRLHDRIVWRINPAGGWTTERLYP